MALPIPVDQLRSKLIAENLITAERFNALLEEANLKNQSIVDILVS